MSDAQVRYVTQEFVYETCCNCHQSFYMVRSKYDACRTKGESFYCPNGHSMHYTDTEILRLKKELEQQKKRTEWAEQNRDSLRKDRDSIEKSRNALKGVITKTKNRIKNGVCPCCTRSFVNVRRHMATKHPEYSKQNEND